MVRRAMRVVVAGAVSLAVLSLPGCAQDDQELADLGPGEQPAGVRASVSRAGFRGPGCRASRASRRNVLPGADRPGVGLGFGHRWARQSPIPRVPEDPG